MNSLLFGLSLFFGLFGLIWTQQHVNERKCGPPPSRSLTLYQKCENGVIKNFLNASSQSTLTGPVATLIIPIVYTVVFLVGLPANAVALWVLLTKVKKLPSVILLVNLALADLLLILFLPFKAVYYFLGSHWTFGEPMCRIVTAAIYGNMYCSILCLMLISIDRYISLVHPFSAKSFRSRMLAISTCAVAWATAIAAMAPFVLNKQSYPINGTDLIICHDVLPESLNTGLFIYYFSFLSGFGFLVPFISILFCYVSIVFSMIRHKERFARTIKITILVLTVFTVCYIPSHVILLLHYFRDKAWQDPLLYLAYMIGLALSTFNSAIDPFLYYYVSDDFRAKVKGALVGLRTQESTQGSQTTQQSSNKMKSEEII
ncbi:PAR4 protein, partial [Atractosteus spatula]|nr:PAR4 protein [Atractosteus spatula]